MITSTDDPRYDQRHQGSVDMKGDNSNSDFLQPETSEPFIVPTANKKIASPKLSSSLLDRIPASSYLSKRIPAQSDYPNELRKLAPARPLSANSALAFISDHGLTGKLRDAPKSLKPKSVSVVLTESTSTPREFVCLTHPQEPVHNHGYDNVDGNLIVHENDVIKSQSYCNMILKGQETPQRLDASDGPSFRVLTLLGQGTFAQVFKCENVGSGTHVAVKVIKNKPAYTNQALMEIEIFEVLNRSSYTDESNAAMRGKNKKPQDPFVNLLCYFMYRSHLCLVFELLGMNLYEILKRRQFRGLPLSIVRDFMKQSLEGMNLLTSQHIIHCDLKPENILVVKENALDFIHAVGEAPRISESSLNIKLIDFGSAGFEGQCSLNAYIQSRFYRSPEILLGIDYDSAIDVWSLGCVAAELLLGLPILPGLNEHDQLIRICEMIGDIPEWMIENGTKATNHFIQDFYKNSIPFQNSEYAYFTSQREQLLLSWRLKTPDEFYASLSEEERSKVSVGKSTHRYFKRKLLQDIILFHGCIQSSDDKGLLPSFVHLLRGMLEIDPWKRLTAYQSLNHPFFKADIPSHSLASYNNLDSIGSTNMGLSWNPPWDPHVTRRKLLIAQKSNRSKRLPVSVPMQSVMSNSYSLSDSPSRISSQSKDLPMNICFSRGSHPNLLALHQRSTGGTDSGVELPVTSRPAFYHSFHSGRTNGPPVVMSSRNFSREDEDLPLHYSAPNDVLPQSFSGVYYDPLHPIVPDLGLALQRPGVIPIRGDSIVPPNLHYIPYHHNSHNHLAMNTLIRSNSMASFHHDSNYGHNRNRHFDNHPSSYSDVYSGNHPASSDTWISPLKNMHRMPIYQPQMEHRPDTRPANATHSLLAQQLYEYSNFSTTAKFSSETIDGNSLPSHEMK